MPVLVPLLSLVAFALEPRPCALLTRGDVVRVLHWSIQSDRESTYRLPQSSGWRCTYEAPEGSVLVVAPNSGSSFFHDNTIYVNKHGKRVSVAVMTTNGTTPASALVAFAKLVARRMP
jgi:hypothetical protein